MLCCLRALSASNDYYQLIEEIIISLSLLFKWYRHSEVEGVEFSRVLALVAQNKEDSRPIGPRCVVAKDGYVITPCD